MANESFRRFKPPAFGASDTELLEFRDRFFNFKSVWRCRVMDRMARANYYQIGRQWIELDVDVLFDNSRGYAFRDILPPDGVQMPRPVLNYVTASVEIELSALGKRQLVPAVLTTSTDPRLEAAAKAAKEILEHRLHENNWPELRELVTFLTIVCGVGCLKSYWDETWNSVVEEGLEGGMQCPSCGYAEAPQEAGPAPAEGTVPSSAPVSPQPGELAPAEPSFDLPPEEPEPSLPGSPGLCPTCQLPMEPMEPEQALEQGKDSMGKPLTALRPKGNPRLEVVSPFDLFPQNSGVDVTPDTCKVWGQASVRSMDWLEEHYPDKCADVMPDEPSELLQYHPLLGEWSILGKYDSALDSGIYADHVRVYEIHGEKSYEFPEGWSLVIAGTAGNAKVMNHGPLYRTVQTPQGPISVPLVKYTAARWKYRHKDFWGQSLVDDLISPQNMLNGLVAQVVEARQRMGSPNILASEAMDLGGPEWNEGYGLGKIMRYVTDPLNPNAQPLPFGGQTMPTEVYMEYDKLLQAMRDIAGPQDVEVGEAPRNVTTTSGLQLLSEKTEARRAPRERALVAMFEKAWEHQLQLEWALRTEPDEYTVETPEGSWERHEYTREAIAGQTKIKIEKQAYIDKSLYQKEAAREAQVDGLYVLDSQLAKKRLLELRGLPTDVNPDLNRQVDLGKRQWIDFVDNGRMPVIDPSIDDFRIRFQTLATMLMQDEGKQLEDAVNWDGINKLIRGWEQELARMEMMDAMAVEFYGGRLPPEQAAPMYQQGMAMFEQQSKEYETKTKPAEEAAAKAGAPPAMATPPPQPPPPPVFLPAAKEDRIYMLWKQMMMRQGVQAVPPAGGLISADPTMMLPPEFAAKQDEFMRFRAVIDAYKLLAEEKEMQAMMAMMPQAPAPGTPDGNPGVGGANPGMGAGPGGSSFTSAPKPPVPPKVSNN